MSKIISLKEQRQFIVGPNTNTVLRWYSEIVFIVGRGFKEVLLRPSSACFLTNLIYSTIRYGYTLVTAKVPLCISWWCTMFTTSYHELMEYKHRTV